MNATLGQGFLYSRPVSSDAILALLHDEHPLMTTRALTVP